MSKTFEKLEKFIKECSFPNIKILSNLPNNKEADEGTIYLIRRAEKDIVFLDEYIFSNNVNDFIKIDSYDMTEEQEGE